MYETIAENNEPATNTPIINALEDKQPALTEDQFRQLRNKFFTVRHYLVPECGHKLDMIKEPSQRNCETCWFAFFSSHGELVQVTDEAIQKQGYAFLVRMRGHKYSKRFTQYMSTLARFKKEQESNEQQGREIQSGGSLGEDDGQGERGINNLSTSGGSSECTSTLDTNKSVISG